ncbi:alkaline phosphatase [Ideonella sp. A 288]|uniref:alkaline phosphatase D family protein n=1 Tax=Ideonella sp. A 288 TaxID=1962181 RepID=UPI000B4B9997|nr:alkaline phosphatase D family protein [Ideonella sp. A 288]
MGRPRKKHKPGVAGPSRRHFIQRVGGSALALGTVPLMQACGGGDGQMLPTPPGTGVFRHGVASGDPLADRVILWTRVTPPTGAPVALDCVVATDTALSRVVARLSLATDASRDHTVKVDVAGLQPDTTYYYRFTADGVASPIGRTRTLPVGTASRMRIAVVSCSNFADGFFNAYRRVAERADLDLVVHLGDYFYEGGNASGSYRAVEPDGELVTLADYRARHALHKRDGDLQELHRQHPMVAMWDDHDIVSDASATGSPSHAAGAEGTWADRVGNALRAYTEWMPVRVANPADLRQAYRGFAFGNLVDLLVLETRVAGRSPQLPGDATLPGTFRQRGAFTDPSREMLGRVQHDWVAGRLRTSTARWKFLAQGVMFAQLKIQAQRNADGGGLYANADQWDGYQPARDRLFQVLTGDGVAPPVRNVVFLTGDAHSAWAADLTQDPNNGDVGRGGYDPDTGAGSVAVEFIGTSVTSPMILDTHGLAESLLRSVNPHLKYIDLARRGYLLIDADASRVVGEWWFVDTVEVPSNGQAFGAAFQVRDGAAHMERAERTSPRANPPALAPA